MKKLIFIVLLSTVSGTALLAQNCSIYFPMEKGTGYEMVTYNAKDKPAGKIKYMVMDTEQSGGMKIAKVKSEFTDAKGKEQFTADYDLKCDGQNVYVDMSSYFQQHLEAYKNMEVTMEAEDFVLPANLKVGQELKDAKVVATMKNNGNKFGSMTLTSKDKKVVGEEKITVPAGTFDCYKIEGNMASENVTMGIPMKFEFKNIEWYANGVGLVRTESYGKNGKLTGYTVLNSRF